MTEKDPYDPTNSVVFAKPGAGWYDWSTFNTNFNLTNKTDMIEPTKEETDVREWPCEVCETGEMKQVGYTQPNGQSNYVCDYCGHRESFP